MVSDISAPGRKKHAQDFRWMLSKLENSEPFQFIRFSDGEMEVLKGHKLTISHHGVEWSRGVSNFKYPAYDHKSFEPSRHSNLRSDLMASAIHTAASYIKGIPTAHNKAAEDRDLMVQLNSGVENLTFSDLLINANYRLFTNEMLPILWSKSCTVVTNFRAKPSSYIPNWSHVKVGDNFFEHYLDTLAHVLEEILKLPHGSLVLGSASSLTNILGLKISLERPDITLIDIGTSLHSQLGLGAPKRDYFEQVMPLTRQNAKAKIAYYLGGSSRFRW